MRAIVITRNGGPEVLEPAERPAPEPGQRAVRCRDMA
jgi:NADPH2:quinone reductase